jgi:hypothetical protein
MIERMNLHMPTVSNRSSVASDAGAGPFAGGAKSAFRLSAVSIIRIIQGR